MGNTFRVHRMDETHIIHKPVHLGKKIRGKTTALSLLGKLPERFHNPLTRASHTSLGDHPCIIKREHFAIFGNQPWFVVKTVHLTDATLHEKKNHPLGFGGSVGQFGGQRIAGARPLGHCCLISCGKAG